MDEATGIMQNAFRQLEERSLSAELLLMCWSPCMDLIALANVNGEVLLQRLSWQKQPVWILSAPASEATSKQVSAIAWRPDGKVLAVGYKSGHLLLCSVENADVLHSIVSKSSITCMQWVETDEPDGINKTAVNMDRQEWNLLAEESETFLSKLPGFNKMHSVKAFADDGVEDTKKLKGQKRLNVLVVGFSGGTLHMYAYGIAAICEVELLRTCQQHFSTQLCSVKIIAATISRDLHSVSVLVEQTTAGGKPKRTVLLLTLDCILLSSRLAELTVLSIQKSKVLTFLEYLNATLHAVSESREDILMEIETKLTKYAEQKKTPGSVRDELLQLLLWGRASPELQAFLLHDLTEKGMKKLGQSVENSYSNIQKLVLKHVHSVGRSLMFHLSLMKGMALWYDKYGIIGLSPAAIQDAIGAVGSFMLKASELLQVIDTSLKNFKAFFRWLYVVMMRLSEEPVPSSLNKVRQRDINFITTFLAENFAEEVGDSDETSKQSGFTLEKVGQYLKRQDLQFPFASPASVKSWQACIDGCSHLKVSPLLHKSQPTKSLMQLYDDMGDAIKCALGKPAVAVGGSVKCSEAVTLFTDEAVGEDGGKVHPCDLTVNQHFLCGTACIYTVLLREAPSHILYLIKQPHGKLGTQGMTEVLGLYFTTLGLNDSFNVPDPAISQRCNQHEIMDAAFFDDQTLSVLLQERCSGPDSVSVLCQVAVASLSHHPFTRLPSEDDYFLNNSKITRIDAGPYVTHSRRLNNMKANMFAVSGSRKVSCVLFCNRRRVRLFDMDAEDDGEDESLSERCLQDLESIMVEETTHDDMCSDKENIHFPDMK